MHFSLRTTTALVCSCLVATIVAGCGGDGGSPLRPSGAGTGAVIAGTVRAASGAAAAGTAGSGRIRPADSPFSGLTVRVVGANRSAVVNSDGQFEISDVPGGNVKLQFTGDGINVTITVNNVTNDQFIQIEIQLSGSSGQILDESRTGKISLCHAEGNGTYHLIDISESAESAHRDHGDAQIGEPVPGRTTMIFDENCRPTGPSVEIKKFTNGEDADNAPGPEIPVGNTVTWTYVVKNAGTVNLTGIVVADNQGVAVNCNGQTTLAAGSSMTCTGTGVAVVGQYSNVGTVTANYTFNSTSGQVSDSDPSHYLGVTPEQEQTGQKVNICHRTGAGFYVLIDISIDAEPAHLAHGDGRPGQAVPGQAGKTFSSTCSVQ